MGVVEDEVFEMGEFAFNPERSAGVGEMRAFDKALADRAGAQALVESGERVFGVRQRPRERAPRQGVEKADAQRRHREAGLAKRGSFMTIFPKARPAWVTFLMISACCPVAPEIRS
ncbi:hypothetical protein [Rhodoblastus acidophilus]|uniref:hypothetical protein n=1 Tax=Rhodoblastus acidophilus TaxID=1074 RepID=UPI001FCF1106|nr:hypothetical protein [Rhodoblastus acidophilus]